MHTFKLVCDQSERIPVAQFSCSAQAVKQSIFNVDLKALDIDSVFFYWCLDFTAALSFM